MIPQFGPYDFFLVVTNRSSGPKKHLVADVYANRKATNNPDSGWFSFSRSNKIGRLSVYRLYPGCVIRLKGADGQRYETRLARDPNIDTIREQLAYWVNSSSSLAELLLTQRASESHGNLNPACR